MEDEIPFGIFRPEKQVYFFRKRLAPITFQPDFPETFGKSDKQSALLCRIRICSYMLFRKDPLDYDAKCACRFEEWNGFLRLFLHLLDHGINS